MCESYILCEFCEKLQLFRLIDIVDKPSWNSDGVSAKRIQKDMLMSSVLVFEYVTTCDGSAIHLPTLSVPIVL